MKYVACFISHACPAMSWINFLKIGAQTSLADYAIYQYTTLPGNVIDDFIATGVVSQKALS
jgi:hypothetical protein